MDKTLGIIINNQNQEMGDLVVHRNLITLPIFGRFRMVDFVLSNMVNSGMDKVAVIASDKYRSLLDHLGTGQDWGMCSKGQSLIFMQGAAQFGAESKYYINLMDFIKNDIVFKRNKHEHILIATPAVISNINYAPFIAKHRLSNADVTIITQNIDGDNRKGSLYLTTDETGRVEKIHEAITPSTNKEVVGVVIIKRSVLQELMSISEKVYRFELIELVNDNIERLNVQAQDFTGYHRRVTDVKSYFDTNMEILEENKQMNQLFDEENDIYTKIKDNHPTQYLQHSSVSQSYIASGCRIDGNVNKSVIFREATIGESSNVNHCILMDRCKVGKNVTLEYVIADRSVKISDNVVLKGSESSPVILKKEMVI